MSGDTIAHARSDVLRRLDLSGSRRRSALTEVTDAWLEETFERAAANTPIPSALVAVGGHGRGELAPGSDLDLLLIHRGNANQAAALAEGTWYPVWDAGLPLDHSVRTLAEARRIAASDIKALLGMLDARCIAGREDLVQQLREAVLADWRAMVHRRISDLRSLVDVRRERWGDLAHMLEPHLKEAYGGLRETTILRGIAASWITDISHHDWPEAAELLLDVRDGLHVVTGSRSDVLLLQEQGPVADHLNFPSPDALLRAVYDAARTIAYASDHVWQRIDRLTWRESRPTGRLLSRRSADRVPLAQGVVRQGGEVVLAHDADPATDPNVILRAAVAAAQTGIPIAQHTLARLTSERADLPTPWPRETRELFVSLLGAGPSLIHTWEGLDQAGVIDALIPGWAVVRSAPQRNPMHRFTVDRHLIETVIQCQTREVRRPDLLLVGALLHDFGKARGGDHSVIGAELAAELLPDMGFDETECATIVTLVRHHLLLPDMATGRDLDDPATIAEVCALVPDVEHIELLGALSRADALATGPAVSSEWRLGLIASLARRCVAALQGLPTPKPPKLSDQEDFLLHQAGTWVTVTQQPDGCEVVVAAPDAPGFLALIAAVLTARHLQVRAARVDTHEGRALQRWYAAPFFGSAPSGEELHDDVRRAVAGHYDPVARLAAREEASPRGDLAPAHVFVSTPGGSKRTLVEVRAQDRPGLLHRITSTMSAHGIAIHGAKVDTRGVDVVDVFFVTDDQHRPLSAERSMALRESLLTALT